MEEGHPQRGLTRKEFDAVIRRAAELAASDAESGEGTLSEAELLRIAAEVGLTERHVRQALVEVRTGVAGGGVLDRLFGPAHVRASRLVPGSPDALAANLDDFLVASQLLQRVRRGRDMLQYRPAVDWASQIARAASFSSRKYYIASARSVEVRLEEADEGRTLVELYVDPGTRRDDVVGAVIGGVMTGGVLGTLVGFGLGAVLPVSVAVLGGLVVGGGVVSGLGYMLGRGHQRKVREVYDEVEGVLDALEAGQSLEPPPPSWKRWVKRHFHGVARDLMRDSVDDRDRR